MCFFRDSKHKVVVQEERSNYASFTTQDLKENLERVNFWIVNCDQKASFVLAIIGVGLTVSFSVDTFKEIKTKVVQPIIGNDTIPWLQISIVFFLMTSFVCILVSLVSLLFSLRAKTDLSKFTQPGMQSKSMLHFESVSKMTYKEYVEERTEFINDLRTQVYVNSVICTSKFKHYKRGVMALEIAVLPILITIILILFL